MIKWDHRLIREKREKNEGVPKEKIVRERAETGTWGRRPAGWLRRRNRRKPNGNQNSATKATPIPNRQNPRRWKSIGGTASGRRTAIPVFDLIDHSLFHLFQA